MRVVISDTGPLNYLVLIGHIDLLPRLFTSVLIPEAVRAELDDTDTPPLVRTWLASAPPWLTVRTPAVPSDPGIVSLDPGEQAAIALAVELRADLLLMDDRAGTAEARARGFATTGTLGILILAAEQGLVDLEGAFGRLTRTSFRYRQEMLNALLARHKARREPH